jgi:hypothetical protein
MPNDEISDLLTQIVKLERKVSDLTLLAQHLFALVHQTQRITRCSMQDLARSQEGG